MKSNQNYHNVKNVGKKEEGERRTGSRSTIETHVTKVLVFLSIVPAFDNNLPTFWMREVGVIMLATCGKVLSIFLLFRLSSNYDSYSIRITAPK